MGVQIHITYCGGWGYGPKFRRVKEELEKKFPGLEVTGEPTKGMSGAFEVQIVGGALLHSKNNGDGYVDNSAKMDKICAGIQAVM